MSNDNSGAMPGTGTGTLAADKDGYGWARAPETIDRIKYGRFRNVYLYITEKCQLRCAHCYMGDRLERAITMPYAEVVHTLDLWRRMGGSKLTILGGEPSLHPQFEQIIADANGLGYEKVILTTNGLVPAARKLRRLTPEQFSYVQVSLDGGSSETHDAVRGRGMFRIAAETTKELCERGFDTRIICTVNKDNAGDALRLLDLADDIGVSLVKFHVFSVIGRGLAYSSGSMDPFEWLDFCDELERRRGLHRAQLWYQPTYARRADMARYASEGYRGCIGRTLDRISIFPDGRCYVCSYLFDTDLNFADMVDGRIVLNKGENEFDHFTRVQTEASCGGCKAAGSCMGGCPAESLVMGGSSCAGYPDIVPICRLWKSEI